MCVFSIAVRRYHDQGNLQMKEIIWGLLFLTIHGGEHGSQEAVGEEAESSHL